MRRRNSFLFHISSGRAYARPSSQELAGSSESHAPAHGTGLEAALGEARWEEEVAPAPGRSGPEQDDEPVEADWEQGEVGMIGMRDISEVVQACMEEIVLESAVLQFIMERLDYPLEALPRPSGYGCAEPPPLQ